jgi:phosphopantothenoylcysteine decarboxylase/phosphopantothenate--cysteine ligase
VLVAPAMNNHMYEHAATRANLDTLRSRGVTVLDPGVGALGSKHEWGVGRLPEPPELLAAIEAALAGVGDLDGLRILVTAGGTREPIDSVRFVGNRSSGRMGFALADAAHRRGAAVKVIAANVALPRTPGISYHDVTSAEELASAARAHVERADVLLMAAAVADYRPAEAHAGKLKKSDAGELNLRLVRTEDVLSSLAASRRPDQTLIGFAAEHGEGALDYAREKLTRKGLDAVVLNDVANPAIGFDSAENEVTIVTAQGDRHVAKAAKQDVADAILDMLLSLRSFPNVKVAR